jgi:hypothetical protein
MQAKDASKQAGAIARSKALSPESRSKIATKAALKKAGYPSATHTGSVHIGGANIPCAVLENGQRVVWQREVVGLLTGNKKGGLARYLEASNVQPYAPDKFKNANFDETAIAFEMDGRKAHGFEAEDIVDICKMYLQARKAGVLTSNQIHLAERSEIIVLSLAKLGIAALIDEATGYQEVRDRHALQALLDTYLQKEHAAWAKRFPDEFYKEMFRLRGWSYPTVSGAKPGVVGKYTSNLVYERLAPGLVAELEQRNPKGESGYRKSKHHQWLSDDVGHPALSAHLHAVMGFMRASDTWDSFMRMMDRAYPKKGKQYPLLLED